MTGVGSSPDYDARIVLNGPRCRLWHGLTAEWDYFSYGVQCTSELTFLGTSIDAEGDKVYTFLDSNQTGPCTDGYVDLEETSDPDVMVHRWRTYGPGSTVDAEGLVELTGACSPDF